MQSAAAAPKAKKKHEHFGGGLPLALRNLAGERFGHKVHSPKPQPSRSR